MVTQELINYIKDQLQQGIDQQTIKNNLLQNGWAENDIQQAFIQTNISQTTAQANYPNIKEKKPKIAIILSILFLIIATLNAIGSSMPIAMIVTMNSIMRPINSNFSFLSISPILALSPLIFYFAAVIFYYIALKLRNASNFSAKLGIISLILIPFASAIINQILVSITLSNFDRNQYSFTPNIVNIKSVFQSNFLLLLVLIPLIIFFKKFKFSNVKLSKKEKILFLIPSVFLFFIIAYFLFWNFIPPNSDFEYSKVQSQVNFHIYKPTFTSEKLLDRTNFQKGGIIGDYQNAITATFTINNPLKENTNIIISLKQTNVDQEFNLENYISTQKKEKDWDSVEKISLSNALNQTAYFVMDKSSRQDKYLLLLIFVTKDNVLINAVAHGTLATKEELIQFAESLR